MVGPDGAAKDKGRKALDEERGKGLSALLLLRLAASGVALLRMALHRVFTSLFGFTGLLLLLFFSGSLAGCAWLARRFFARTGLVLVLHITDSISNGIGHKPPRLAHTRC